MTRALDHTRRAIVGAGLAAAAGVPPAFAQGASPARGELLTGLRRDSEEDQTALVQRAVAAAARSGLPVNLPPGRYRIGGLSLPAGTRLAGAGPSATTLVQAGNQPVVVARGGERITLEDIGVEGSAAADRAIPLVSLSDASELRMLDMKIAKARGTAVRLERCGGRIERCAVTEADVGIFSLDARGLQMVGNIVEQCANNGIQIWRSQKGYDGTQVLGNRISQVRAQGGGSGQNGNGINVFRAGGVMVAQNVIRDCAFTAVRNNSGDNVQIIGNACSNLGEVAIYAEFAFEGCVINNNVVDRAAMGISITNFNENGRLAVASGNILRNLFRRPDALSGEINRGVGIGVEADAAVTGNVVEAAEFAGIVIGYGAYLRDVLCSSNVVRHCGYGVAVSVASGAGAAQIVNNILSECRRGRIVGFDREKPISEELAQGATRRFAHLTIQGNTGQ
ncbi:MAG TPA: TIGR03808 family TAT-translocated repetitive protein [Beijerinckiaceae bacterium]|nr:TIGR03808 family TAT-translocated repetitive protein [Beijerinckiaceae bacterium]